MTDLELVAFDIETTGFGVDDVVTVVGFAVEMGVRVFAQTNERDAVDVDERVGERVPGLVNVTVHATERELLEAVRGFARERFRDDDVLVIGFNGERWRGGFDLPFLRTRLARAGIDWVFEDVPYADVQPLVMDRFNTTVEGEDVQDLVGVYNVLRDGSYSEMDPFEDSAEAVAAFEDGEFTELIEHNVADVLRTRALGELAQRYCSKSDFNLKSLTATIDG